MEKHVSCQLVSKTTVVFTLTTALTLHYNPQAKVHHVTRSEYAYPLPPQVAFQFPSPKRDTFG